MRFAQVDWDHKAKGFELVVSALMLWGEKLKSILGEANVGGCRKRILSN